MASGDKRNDRGKNVIHIKNWPEGDRPGERILKNGAEHLSDAALLAVVAGSGAKEKDPEAAAHEILSEFGGFDGLMSTPCSDLIKAKGVGKAKAAQILAAAEILRRRLRRPLSRMNVMESPEHLHDYLSLSMRSSGRQECRLLCLDRSWRLITEDVLFTGPLELSKVHPREIMESALRKKAAAIILAHNHRADLPMVSDAHIQLTKALVRALWNMNIPVLDHVIVGTSSVLSMKRHYPEIFEAQDDIA
jgi:DNA repair protein RadC